MDKEDNLSFLQANSQTIVNGDFSFTPPNQKIPSIGQSVGYVPTSNAPANVTAQKRHWFVIRATRGRAQAVYEKLSAYSEFSSDLYVPTYHLENLKIVDGEAHKVVTEGLYHKGLVFIRTTYSEYRKLVRAEAPYHYIDGLTPYYNHFQSEGSGCNSYLVVPDKQMQDFRKLLESKNEHILIDQASMPTYLNGKQVEIVSGPFAGITGTLLRWKGLRRVFIKIDQIGTFATGFIRTCDFRLLS
ncbi:MAG: hypothetical protein KBT12_09030 [Bacteroidales bacterium]|nr:hypothetical protein [Candidatus Physcousia equi]